MTPDDLDRSGYIPLKQAVKGNRVIVWDGSRSMLGDMARDYLANGWRVRVCADPDREPRQYEWVTE